MHKLLAILFVITFFYSCQKEEIDTSSKNILKFSVDTLTFDTVFQTLGSATRSIRIYNSSDKIIFINKAYLSQGTNSQFRFNLDGASGILVQNIRILPKDSLWLFAEVTVNPNPSNPLLVFDSIIVESNGGKQALVLRAFGQNAHFHNGEVLIGNTTWTSDKPHVILHKTTTSGTVPGVIVTQGSTLNIEEGAQLYFSSSAGIIVQGSLKCNGTKDKTIKMRGLRLEQPFIHAAGQWLGLLFERKSIANEINYTTIDETAFGIWAGFQSTTDFNATKDDAIRPKIYLKNSSITNGYYWVLRSFNAQVYADNCQFYTATDYLVQLLLGGDYRFRNCTVFNIQSKDKKANLLLTNKFYDESTKITHTHKLDNTTLFENCIFNSNTDESIELNIDKPLNTDSDISFKNCNYNSLSNLNSSSFIDCIVNKNPEFESTTIDKENLKLKSNSPCIDKGVNNGLSDDNKGNSRPQGTGYDIGAFESY